MEPVRTSARCSKPWRPTGRPFLLVASLLGTSLQCAGAPFDIAGTLLETRYNAAETASSGFVLDSEQGPLRGAALRLGAQGYGLAAQTEFGRQSGALHYEGRTQLGVPLQTQTDLALNETRVLAGPAGSLDVLGAQLRVQGGVTLREIRRDILATLLSSRATETLRNRTWTGRLAWLQPLAEQPAVALEASVQIEIPWHQDLTVNTYGALDPFVLAPASRPGWSADLRPTWTPAPGWRAWFEFDYAALRYGSGPAKPVFHDGQVAGIASYPGSLQQLRSIGVGTAWSF